MHLITIRGIAIRVDASWLLIAALVAWSFWARFTTLDGETAGTALLMAAAAVALFFLSILLHELAHALEAQRRGVEVRGIKLFLFGGATQTGFEVRRPVDELVLTIVGPYTSLVLAGGFGLVATVADGAGWVHIGPVFGLVGWLNLALAAFNMLPGAPLDGGRVLRAIIWWITGDRDRSVTISARAGQAVAGLLVGLGLAQLVAVEGGGIGGLWLAFIGWFLFQAAGQELAHHRAHQRLSGITTDRVIVRTPPIPPSASIADAVEGWFAPREEEAFLVGDGTPAGMLTMDDVRSVPLDQRASSTVATVMRSLDDLPRIDIAAPADEALESLEDGGVALAVADGEVVGIVTPSRLARYLQRATLLEDAQR